MAWIDTYHLTIVKGGTGPIDIELGECRAGRKRGSPSGHYIHFGPEGQIAEALPRIPRKKGRYRLQGADGSIIETEWVASETTRNALSIASLKGWKGAKRRKARIRKQKETFSLPEQKKLKSDNAKRMWADRKQKLAHYAHLLAEAEGPGEQVKQLKKLNLAEEVSKKLSEPEKYMWLAPNEVAEALGISPATFYRHVKARKYRHLRRNPKGWYATNSVSDQLSKL